LREIERGLGLFVYRALRVSCRVVSCRVLL